MNALTQVPTPARAPEPPKFSTYDARDLVQNGTQACILLDEQMYYLRITRAGKLILTK